MNSSEADGLQPRQLFRDQIDIPIAFETVQRLQLIPLAFRQATTESFEAAYGAESHALWSHQRR